MAIMRIETLYSELMNKLSNQNDAQKKNKAANEIQSGIGKRSTQISDDQSVNQDEPLHITDNESNNPRGKRKELLHRQLALSRQDNLA